MKKDGATNKMVGCPLRQLNLIPWNGLDRNILVGKTEYNATNCLSSTLLLNNSIIKYAIRLSNFVQHFRKI